VTNQQGVASFSGELPERQCMGSGADFITMRNDMTFTASDWTRHRELALQCAIRRPAR
jgi:hypothetical protein